MAATDLRVARHLMICGHVQGVGFRWSMQQQAQSLGLGGWVRNRCNGAVEALVCGPQPAVAALIDWSMHGPVGARVDGVEVESSDVLCDAFTLRPTE